MRILMLTNTYTPLVGGVARSVEAFTNEYRKLGHRVLVVAPSFEDMPEEEVDVIRMPAIQHFNGSDFSVRLPLPGFMTAALDRFQPEIVHSHHPFLIGDSAQRIAALRDLPLVFTFHTMYEQYTHYVPGDSPAMQRFAVQLSTGYANLCEHVIAPSESVEAILRERGVTTPVSVIPTGVDPRRFARHGASSREAAPGSRGIPRGALVVGHVGRLAPEKNLGFLARAVAAYLLREPRAHFLVGGGGPSTEEIRALFEKEGLGERLHLAGTLEGDDLVEAYQAMDVFAFASRSETQGMVLTEAMASGVPVVAVDAPGAREVVKDRRNGRLLLREDEDGFASALRWVASSPPERRRKLREAARKTAQRFSMRVSAGRALELYEDLIRSLRPSRHHGESVWSSALRLIETEWSLWVNLARAATIASTSQPAKPPPPAKPSLPAFREAASPVEGQLAGKR